MLANKQNKVGSAADLLSTPITRGQNALKAYTKILANPHETRQLRTWKIGEAAAILGCHQQTIRKHEKPDGSGKLGMPEYDQSGHRAYSLERLNFIRRELGLGKSKPEGASAAVVSVTIYKGGVGKTNTTISLAHELALRGYRILLIDLDPQGTLTYKCNFNQTFDFTAEETIKNVLLDDPLLIKDVIRETHWPTVDLIPAHEEMEDTDYSLPDPKKSNTKKLGPAVYRLKLALEFVKQDYDIILCDCGPNQGPMTLNALLASDHLLLPILPDLNTFTSSMTYLNRMKSLFTDVEENIQSINFFINNHNGNKQAVAAEAFLREQFDGIILDSTIPTSEGFITAGNNLSSVYELRGKNKNTAVKNSMNYTKKLCDEIMTYVQHGWENQ